MALPTRLRVYRTSSRSLVQCDAELEWCSILFILPQFGDYFYSVQYLQLPASVRAGGVHEVRGRAALRNEIAVT